MTEVIESFVKRHSDSFTVATLRLKGDVDWTGSRIGLLMIGVGGLVTAADGVSQWCGNSSIMLCSRLAVGGGGRPGGAAAVEGAWYVTIYGIPHTIIP